MEEVQTGWDRHPVGSLVSEGLCRWRSVRHLIMAATPTATSAGRTTSTLLMFESPASTHCEHLGSPGGLPCFVLCSLCTIFHFHQSNYLLYYLFACLSSQQRVNFLRAGRIESCLKIFFESFHSSPSPLWVSTVSYVISLLQCTLQWPSCHHCCHPASVFVKI